MPTLGRPLDIFGQNARLSGVYTQLCFCFPLPDVNEDTQAKVINHLKNGLTRLTEALPWVAGKVAINDGTYCVIPYLALPRLRRLDVSFNMDGMEVFRETRFPYSLIHELDFSSQYTLPTARPRGDDTYPVFAVKATFIERGVFVDFDAQHNCMDIVGQGQLISLFSKACRGESFTADELEYCNMPSRLSNQYVGVKEQPGVVSHYERPAPEDAASDDSTQEVNLNEDWFAFRFSEKAQKALKDLASQSVDDNVTFVSTDDALSALVWQSVTRARMYRLKADDMSTFDRQVDARSFVGMAPEYIGNMTHKTSSRRSVSAIVSQPLGVLAVELRAALIPQSKIADGTYAAARALHRQLLSGKSSSPARSRLPSTDIKMSSWTKIDSYKLDFGGILGRPEAVRRPAFDAWEGLAYLLPKSPDGEIVLCLNLRAADLKRLKEDFEFMKYVTYVEEYIPESSVWSAERKMEGMVFDDEPIDNM